MGVFPHGRPHFFGDEGRKEILFQKLNLIVGLLLLCISGNPGKEPHNFRLPSIFRVNLNDFACVLGLEALVYLIGVDYASAPYLRVVLRSLGILRILYYFEHR